MVKNVGFICPDYYKEFKCIAGECRHSCCIGWEIDIDKRTMDFYNSVGGEMGSRLKKNIKREEICSFILGDGERCPFLNDKNLCDIIIELGEEHISHICREHPRFYNEIGDRCEAGLGLACEEAARLVLSKKTKTVLIGAENEPCDDEILALRDELIKTLQIREKIIKERLSDVLLLCKTSIPRKSISEWADFLLSLESMDKLWQEKLSALKELCEDDGEFEEYMTARETEYEQFAVYLIYRHFWVASDMADAAARACFAVFGVWLIYALGMHEFMKNGEFSFEEQVELVRMFSSEIEYSEDNTNALLDEFYIDM